MITLTTAEHFKTIIHKMMAGASEAIAQVAQEAEERERIIETLNQQNAELRKRIDTLEARNDKLIEDLMKLEAKVVEQDVILANVRKAANGEPKAA